MNELIRLIVSNIAIIGLCYLAHRNKLQQSNMRMYDIGEKIGCDIGYKRKQEEDMNEAQKYWKKFEEEAE